MEIATSSDAAYLALLIKDERLHGHYTQGPLRNVIEHSWSENIYMFLYPYVRKIHEEQTPILTRMDTLMGRSFADREIGLALKLGVTSERLGGAMAQLEKHFEQEIGNTNDQIARERFLREWISRSIPALASSLGNRFKNGRDGDPCELAAAQMRFLDGLRPIYDNSQGRVIYPFHDFSLPNVPKLPSCIDCFDQHELDGGFERGTITILSGESNIGKSHTALGMLATAVRMGHPSLMVSAEDGAPLTKKRIYAHFLNASRREIMRMTPEERETRFSQIYAAEQASAEDIHERIRNGLAFSHQTSLRIKDIADDVDRAEQVLQRRIELITADYLQRSEVDGEQYQERTDQKLCRFVGDLVDYCGNRGTNAILVSQISSSATEGVAEFTGLSKAVANSYAAIWMAHYVITMTRTKKESLRMGTSADKRARLGFFLCKAKDASTGTCYALSIPSQSRQLYFRSEEARNLYIEQHPYQE